MKNLLVTYFILFLLSLFSLAGCGAELPSTGPQGQQGPQGPQGPKGDTGESGVVGPPGASVVFVDPCPASVATYPELLAFVDGKYYGVYASGVKIHLVLLTPGNYVTTDGRACAFTIDANGVLL